MTRSPSPAYYPCFLAARRSSIGVGQPHVGLGPNATDGLTGIDEQRGRRQANESQQQSIFH